MWLTEFCFWIKTVRWIFVTKLLKRNNLHFFKVTFKTPSLLPIPFVLGKLVMVPFMWAWRFLLSLSLYRICRKLDFQKIFLFLFFLFVCDNGFDTFSCLDNLFSSFSLSVWCQCLQWFGFLCRRHQTIELLFLRDEYSSLLFSILTQVVVIVGTRISLRLWESYVWVANRDKPLNYYNGTL